jgi:hypothetical protein
MIDTVAVTQGTNGKWLVTIDDNGQITIVEFNVEAYARSLAAGQELRLRRLKTKFADQLR